MRCWKKKKNPPNPQLLLFMKPETRIRAIQTKLQRLLDGYLEQDIEREIYRVEKAKLLSEKKSLDEQMARIEQKRTGWLEPMTEWIKEAENLPQNRTGEQPFCEKGYAKEIFGSNLVLAAERRASARHCIEFPHKISGRRFAPPRNRSIF